MKYIKLLIVLLIMFIGCRKETSKQAPFFHSILQDSLYRYAQDVYLWNNQLPSSQFFFRDNYLNDETEEKVLRNEILSISNYAINESTGKSYEFMDRNPNTPKYSKIFSFSSNIQSNENFGISFIAFNNSLFVQYVIPGSPAHDETLKRGDQILKINSRDFSLSNNNIEKFLKSERLELEVKRKDKIFDVLLFKRPYNISPINHISLLNNRTGYISLLEFSNISVENLRSRINELGDIDNLIIDLRYNSGGYVNLVEELANLIIPNSLNKSVMRKERYNITMQSGKAFSLKNQFLTKNDDTPIFINNHAATLFDIDYSIDANTYLFDKKTGPSNVKKIVFIVSEKTASASELLISILRPYVETKIIGVSLSGNNFVRTYGKPVGFFKLKLGQYDLYLSMFQNLNKNNDGEYYNGIPADYSVLDNVKYDFGDKSDESINAALSIMSGINLKKNTTIQRKQMIQENFREIKSIPLQQNILIKTF